MDWLPAAALAGLSVASLLLARRVRSLLGEVATLSSRVEMLASRLEAAEHDISSAVARTEVAETVLLEKGLADQEDLDAARRRSDPPPPADADVSGDHDLH